MLKNPGGYMATFINCTPHELCVHDSKGGVVKYPPSGNLPRVAAGFSDFNDKGICQTTFGDVENLPDQVDGVYLVVSAMVLTALHGSRGDVVAPATGHPDCKRDQGRIISVPGFVQ